MASLPSVQDVQNSSSQPDSPLAVALTILFEHSPILISRLAPELVATFSEGLTLSTYAEFIDVALHHIGAWNTVSQSEFISGHPRIGESKHLSNLSAKEQGAQGLIPTPPEVLERLAYLNACYEVVYPGLRYITFVNGRTRAAILEELEGVLGLQHSLSTVEPAITDLKPVAIDGDAWRAELTRAIDDIGRIAKSRLNALGVY